MKKINTDSAHGSAWYPLFEHMSREHGLTLLDDELATIAFKADESRLKSAGGVAQGNQFMTSQQKAEALAKRCSEALIKNCSDLTGTRRVFYQSDFERTILAAIPLVELLKGQEHA